MHSVKLKCISRPVDDDIPSTAALLAYFARVSSSANQHDHASGPKLLRTLVRRKEWSPLEMIHMTMEIVTTRDIARQILRHRSFSFQEFSQRYAEVTDDPIFREARLQDHKDRQNSIETGDEELHTWWEGEQAQVAAIANTAYEHALKCGIAKEVARAVLPEGITVSRLYMGGTLRSWLHYCDLRCDRKTQKEHRLIADDVKAIILDQLPELKDVWNVD